MGRNRLVMMREHLVLPAGPWRALVVAHPASTPHRGRGRRRPAAPGVRSGAWGGTRADGPRGCFVRAVTEGLHGMARRPWTALPIRALLVMSATVAGLSNDVLGVGEAHLEAMLGWGEDDADSSAPALESPSAELLTSHSFFAVDGARRVCCRVTSAWASYTVTHHADHDLVSTDGAAAMGLAVIQTRDEEGRSRGWSSRSWSAMAGRDPSLVIRGGVVDEGVDTGDDARTGGGRWPTSVRRPAVVCDADGDLWILVELRTGVERPVRRCQ